MADSWKFGDLIENCNASTDNPTRQAYFVRAAERKGRLNPGRYAELTDGKGNFWKVTLAGQALIKVASAALPSRDT